MTPAVRILRHAVMVVLRAVRDAIPHDAKRWLLQQGQRILPPTAMGRLRAVNDRVKRTSPAQDRSLASPSRSSPGGVVSDRLPVRACVLLGFDEDALHRIVRDIRTTAVVEGDHCPLVVTDSLAFATLREQRVAFEYVPSYAAWQAASHDQSWVSFLRRRLDHILEVHQPERTTILTSAVPADAGLPVALLTPYPVD